MRGNTGEVDRAQYVTLKEFEPHVKGRRKLSGGF